MKPPLKQCKQPNVRARRARLGSMRGCHGAGWCLPVRARSLEPSAVECSKRGGACEVGRPARESEVYPERPKMEKKKPTHVSLLYDYCLATQHP